MSSRHKGWQEEMREIRREKYGTSMGRYPEEKELWKICAALTASLIVAGFKVVESVFKTVFSLVCSLAR